jgi:LPXTG-motif cell wall-anchored protein
MYSTLASTGFSSLIYIALGAAALVGGTAMKVFRRKR